MRRLPPAVLCSALLALACGQNEDGYVISPTAPGPIVVPAAAANPLSGVVSDNHAPVVGARVLVFGDVGVNQQVTATDTGGHYSFSDVGPVACPPACTMVSASQPGFFSDIKYAETARSDRIDFELDPLVYISLGEAVAGLVGDATCSGLGYGQSPCQRFAIAVHSSGNLEVTSSGPFNFDFDVVGPDGMFAIYTSGSPGPFRVSIPVEAGLTYQIRVVAISSVRDFTLTTALR